MIMEDFNIRTKVLKIWKDWKDVERTSRKEDRAMKPSFLVMQEKFEKEVLDMPFNTLCKGCEEVLQHSGIKDWKKRSPTPS